MTPHDAQERKCQQPAVPMGADRRRLIKAQPTNHRVARMDKAITTRFQEDSPSCDRALFVTASVSAAALAMNRQHRRLRRHGLIEYRDARRFVLLAKIDDIAVAQPAARGRSIRNRLTDRYDERPDWVGLGVPPAVPGPAAKPVVIGGPRKRYDERQGTQIAYGGFQRIDLRSPSTAIRQTARRTLPVATRCCAFSPHGPRHDDAQPAGGIAAGKVAALRHGRWLGAGLWRRCREFSVNHALCTRRSTR